MSDAPPDVLGGPASALLSEQETPMRGNGAQTSSRVPRRGPASRFRATASRVGGIGVLVALVSAAPTVARHVHAAALLSRAGGQPGGLARAFGAAFDCVDEQIPTPTHALRGRLCRPRGRGASRGLVLVHGAQHQGIDEDRVMRLAHALTADGFIVLTPEVRALTDFTLDVSALDDIRAAVRSLTHVPGVETGGVGLVGASVAGGLALRLAAEPEMAGAVAFVVSVGGHHDLRNVLTAAVRADTPARRPRADPYVIAVFANAYAEHLVNTEQVATFREALRAHLAWDDATAQRIAEALQGDARALLTGLLAGDTRAIARRLYAALPALASRLEALSPAGHLAGLQGLPVFLVHGTRDAVVPATEAIDNARELGNGPSVHLLITPLLDHVTLSNGASLSDRFRAIHFAAALLAE